MAKITKRKGVSQKKLTLVPKEEKYTPKEDNKIYIYIQRKKNLLTPIPYVWRPNYQYVIDIIKSSKKID